MTTSQTLPVQQGASGHAVDFDFVVLVRILGIVSSGLAGVGWGPCSRPGRIAFEENAASRQRDNAIAGCRSVGHEVSLRIEGDEMSLRIKCNVRKGQEPLAVTSWVGKILIIEFENLFDLPESIRERVIDGKLIDRHKDTVRQCLPWNQITLGWAAGLIAHASLREHTIGRVLPGQQLISLGRVEKAIDAWVGIH